MPFSFLPRMIYPHLTDVRAEDLRARGIGFLMLDFDNTIVPYTTSVPTDAMTDWLSAMQRSGIGLCVVSNSKKPRVVAFCEKYGLACITHAKKPFSRGIRACLARFSLEPARCALVGDQIYTDVLGANCAGVQSILIRAIHNHTIWLKLRHVAELPFIAIAKRRIKHEEHRKV